MRITKMCPTTSKAATTPENNNVQDNEPDSSDSGDTSDVSMSDSDNPSDDDDQSLPDNDAAIEDDPDEDDVIKAMRREADRKRDHPPAIHCDDFILDISFHPHADIIAAANIVGDVLFYKYTNDENTLVQTLEVHTKSCRDIEFSQDGRTLFSTAKDKSIVLSDTDTGKLMRFYENSHDVPVYCLTIIDENLFATGDDDGTVKLWDQRQNNDNPIYKMKKNDDYISGMITNEAKKYLLCTSGDGSLTTLDLQQRKCHMQSEEYDEELTCLGLFRNETKLLVGSTKGKLLLYNWNEFGLHSDEFPGNKAAINDLVPITEDIVVTACEDGHLRAVHLFPHRYLGVVGQHDLSVENVDICNSGELIASSSHNNDIKFWNINYFEDFAKLSQKHKKCEKRNELRNNLPSSKIQNNADFFSDLC